MKLSLGSAISTIWKRKSILFQTRGYKYPFIKHKHIIFRSFSSLRNFFFLNNWICFAWSPLHSFPRTWRCMRGCAVLLTELKLTPTTTTTTTSLNKTDSYYRDSWNRSGWPLVAEWRSWKLEWSWSDALMRNAQVTFRFFEIQKIRILSIKYSLVSFSSFHRLQWIKIFIKTKWPLKSL